MPKSGNNHIQTRGGNLPAWTLTIYNFFNIGVKAAKLLRLYLKCIWEQFGMTCHCSRICCYHGSHPLTEIFFQVCFFKRKKNNFLAKTFTFLDHFSILLLVLVTFESFLVLFWRTGKITKSNMADPRWRLMRNHDAISTSCDAIILCCIRQ